MAAAVEAAFADPNALTAGFIAVYKGRIIGERYMPGITKDTQLESWSMGKSIVSTLFALLVKDGTSGSISRPRSPNGRTPTIRAGTSRPRICCA